MTLHWQLITLFAILLRWAHWLKVCDCASGCILIHSHFRVAATNDEHINLTINFTRLENSILKLKLKIC